jgi:hypothetical protein
MSVIPKPSSVVTKPRSPIPRQPHVHVTLPHPQPAPAAVPAQPVALPPERFKATELFDPKRIGAVVMYCSDGRWGDAFDEFCRRSLQIPRYDRFAVPGGPAWLTIAQAQKKEDDCPSLEASLSRSAWENLGLLVRVHELSRIVLVAHYGCAFYVERYKKPADDVLPIQLADLQRARNAVRERFPRLTVETYMAMRHDERLCFHGTV